MKSLVIINPRSGDYSINRFITDFIVKKPDWLFTDILLLDNSFIYKFMENSYKNYDNLIIAGGDGTISAISSLISDFIQPPPFAVIPIGTGNDFSRSSGWYDIWKNGGYDYFFYHLKDSNKQPIDIWMANEKKFICYLSLGWDASVVYLYHQIKKRLGNSPQNRKKNTLLYVYCALIKIKDILINKKKSVLSISEDNINFRKTGFSDADTMIFSNITSYAGGTSLNSVNYENDGKIDVFHIKSPIEYIFFIINGRFNLFGKKKPLKRLRNVEINSDVNYYYQMDGESGKDFGEKNLRISQICKINYLKPSK